jgi:hypothetical protein
MQNRAPGRPGVMRPQVGQAFESFVFVAPATGAVGAGGGCTGGFGAVDGTKGFEVEVGMGGFTVVGVPGTGSRAVGTGDFGGVVATLGTGGFGGIPPTVTGPGGFGGTAFTGTGGFTDAAGAGTGDRGSEVAGADGLGRTFWAGRDSGPGKSGTAGV